MVEDEDFVGGRSSHATVKLEVGALAETSPATFELLSSLARRRLEGLDSLSLLTNEVEGLVTVLHLLFSVAKSEYEEGPENLWVVNGELPYKGLLTLVNLLCLPVYNTGRV